MDPQQLHRGSHRRPTALLLTGFALGLLTGCTDDSTGPSAEPPPDIRFVNLSQPVDLTPDGSLAAIQDGGSLSGELYFYHTATGQLELKTRVGDPLRDFATAMSANGLITALHGDPVQAGFWTEAGEWTDLSSSYSLGCDQDVAGAWDVSADGRSIVGLVWHQCNAEAFRWDATGSGIMTPLQRLGAPFTGSVTPPANRATVISDDGSTVAGWAQTSLVDRWPAIWRADGTGFLLTGNFTSDTPGEVLAISPDGKMVSGIWGVDGFYWTQASGVVNIGQLPNADPVFDNTYANAIAAGGRLILGGCGSPFFTVPRAFAWTAAAGMQQLDSIAVHAGVDIPGGYLLTNVLAASNDGRVILGTAYAPDSRQVTFVLHLPLSAYGLQ